MGEGNVTLNQLTAEVRQLFELGTDAGQAKFLEEEIRQLVGFVEDAKRGIDQTLERQRNSPLLRQKGEDYFIPEWHGDVYTGIRGWVGELIKRNEGIQARLQQKDIEPERFADYATNRVLGVIQRYTQTEVNKAFAAREAEKSKLESSRRRIIPANTYRSRILELFVGSDVTEVTAKMLIDMKLIEGYTREHYGTLLRSMGYDSLLIHVKKGRDPVYKITDKGKQRYQEYAQKQAS